MMSLLRGGIILLLTLHTFSLTAQFETGLTTGVVVLDGEYSNFIRDNFNPNITVGCRIAYDYKDYFTAQVQYDYSSLKLTRNTNFTTIPNTISGQFRAFSLLVDYNLIRTKDRSLNPQIRRFHFGPTVGIGYLSRSEYAELSNATLPPNNPGIMLADEQYTAYSFLLGAYFKYRFAQKWVAHVHYKNYFTEDAMDGIIGSTERTDITAIGTIGVSYRFE